MTQPASVGSQLLYTYQASDHCKKQAVGQSRPAVVVRSWGTCYNVQVLTDGVNDFDDKRALLHLASVQLSDCIAKGRLHWPGSPVEVESAPEPSPTIEDVLEVVASPLLVDGVPYTVGDLPPGAVFTVNKAAEPVEQIQTTIAPPSAAPKKNKGGRPKKAK